MKGRTTMTKTIFIGHEVGTFKAYYGLGPNGKSGWYVMFLGENGNTSYPDGHHIYNHRSNAYRRAKQLNDLLRQQAEN